MHTITHVKHSNKSIGIRMQDVGTAFKVAIVNGNYGVDGTYRISKEDAQDYPVVQIQQNGLQGIWVPVVDLYKFKEEACQAQTR